jgi:hypothetical protein
MVLFVPSCKHCIGFFAIDGVFKQISGQAVLLFREQNFERVGILSTSLTKKDPEAGRTQEGLFRFSERNKSVFVTRSLGILSTASSISVF